MGGLMFLFSWSLIWIIRLSRRKGIWVSFTTNIWILSQGGSLDFNFNILKITECNQKKFIETRSWEWELKGKKILRNLLLIFPRAVIVYFKGRKRSYPLSKDRQNTPQGNTVIPRYLVLLRFADVAIFFFLQIEGLWQPCVEQVYQCHFSNSICSHHVFMKAFLDVPTPTPQSWGGGPSPCFLIQYVTLYSTVHTLIIACCCFF